MRSVEFGDKLRVRLHSFVRARRVLPSTLRRGENKYVTIQSVMENGEMSYDTFDASSWLLRQSLVFGSSEELVGVELRQSRKRYLAVDEFLQVALRRTRLKVSANIVVFKIIFMPFRRQQRAT